MPQFLRAKPRRISSILPHRRPFAASALQRGIRQSPDSDAVRFPGAVESKFTHELAFHRPQDVPAMPTYRYINAEGVVVDTKSKLGIDKDKALKMYKDMVTTSVMDLIMWDLVARSYYCRIG
jgi:2-oxoisovalerate dehydrogenase E1 component alpha subunit